MLQPARFVQNWVEPWREVVAHGVLPMPSAVTSSFCFVDYRDVAEVAARDE